MLLAFYRVGNSQKYDRHTFDNYYDKPDVIKEMLAKLNDDEFRIYDMNAPSPNLPDFVEDYNDEELDGGWWVVALNC